MSFAVASPNHPGPSGHFDLLASTRRLVRRSLALLGIMAGWGGVFGPLSGAAPGSSPPKIDPRIWEDTAHGQTARFLVVLAEQADTPAIARQHPDRAVRGRQVVAALRETAERTQPPLRALLQAHQAAPRSYWVANLILVEGRRGLVEALAARRDLRALESDRPFRTHLARPEAAGAQASSAPVEPNLELIGATNLWFLGQTGQGIVFANADTGVDWTHPALRNQYRGWNGQTTDHNYHWWDAIRQDISGNGTNPVGFGSRVPVDDDGHGTHVMGIGVGDDGAGNRIGVAPGARWIACRNMDEGVGRPGTYLECFQFFLAPTDLEGNNPDPDRRPDCLSNSYACPPDELCAPDSLHLALQNLRAAGIFVAAAAGNYGPACGTVRDPPGLDAAAVTVGATLMNDSIASFSSRGPVRVDGSQRRKPDLVAPGVSIRSAHRNATYAHLSGTSMATPHLAGAVALLWAAQPHLRRAVDYTQTLLEQSAVPLTSDEGCGGDQPGQVPNHVFGHGRVDVWAAFQTARDAPLADDLIVTTQANLPIPLTLTGSDPGGGAFQFEIVSLPGHGLISLLDPPTGTLVYRPAHTFVGEDQFAFRTRNGIFHSRDAFARLLILPPPDRDGDGMPDGWETAHGLDPDDPADARADPDQDSRTNLEEYLAHTDPHDAACVLRLTGLDLDAVGNPTLTWRSIGGTRYRVQVALGAPGAALFRDLPRSVLFEMDPAPAGVVGGMRFTDFLGSPRLDEPRLYRVRTTP